MCRKVIIVLTLALALGALAGCAEHHGPMERAGQAVDHAANKTADAVGTALEKTGSAIERGGQKIQQKVDQKASGNG
ncbi:MAG: hypothetical protein ACP5VF_06080 [Acidobacteriota bacterium]